MSNSWASEHAEWAAKHAEWANEHAEWAAEHTCEWLVSNWANKWATREQMSKQMSNSWANELAEWAAEHRCEWLVSKWVSDSLWSNAQTSPGYVLCMCHTCFLGHLTHDKHVARSPSITQSASRDRFPRLVYIWRSRRSLCWCTIKGGMFIKCAKFLQ